MRARIARLLTRRGLWLALGGPVAAFVALCTVASVSLLPPSVKPSSLAFFRATTQVYVMPPGALGSSLAQSTPTAFTGQSITLANVMSVDAPIPSYLPLAAQEPPGAKRATQIVDEGDPYRLTIDTNLTLPAIAITAQAPSPATAVRIAAAAQKGLAAYVTRTEASAGTPTSLRLQVRSLGPISVVGDDSGGLANVAGFAFIITLTLWCGLVITACSVGRSVRAARRARGMGVQVLNAPRVGSETSHIRGSLRRLSLPRTAMYRSHNGTAIELGEGAKHQWK
jgi:hypothetical protein